MAVFFLSWPKPEHLPSIPQHSWKQFDIVGSVLIISAAVLIVFPFQNVGESSQPAWNSAMFIAPLVVGIVLWFALVAWSYIGPKVYKNRLALVFPVTLFYNRPYAVAALSTLFLGYPYFVLTYAFPLRAQVVDGRSSLIAGIMLLPMLVASAVGSILAGVVSKTKNYLFETMLVGAVMMTLGTGLLTMVRSAGDESKALGFIVFAGFGFGLSVASCTIMTSLEVPIVDYGRLPAILSFLYSMLMTYSPCSGHHCATTNPWWQLGHRRIFRHLEQQISRVPIRYTLASTTSHARSRRRYVARADCSSTHRIFRSISC